MDLDATLSAVTSRYHLRWSAAETATTSLARLQQHDDELLALLTTLPPHRRLIPPTCSWLYALFAFDAYDFLQRLNELEPLPPTAQRRYLLQLWHVLHADSPLTLSLWDKGYLHTPRLRPWLIDFLLLTGQTPLGAWLESETFAQDWLGRALEHPCMATPPVRQQIYQRHGASTVIRQYLTLLEQPQPFLTYQRANFTSLLQHGELTPAAVAGICLQLGEALPARMDEQRLWQSPLDRVFSHDLSVQSAAAALNALCTSTPLSARDHLWTLFGQHFLLLDPNSPACSPAFFHESDAELIAIEAKQKRVSLERWLYTLPWPAPTLLLAGQPLPSHPAEQERYADTLWRGGHQAHRHFAAMLLNRYSTLWHDSTGWRGGIDNPCHDHTPTSQTTRPTSSVTPPALPGADVFTLTPLYIRLGSLTSWQQACLPHVFDQTHRQALDHYTLNACPLAQGTAAQRLLTLLEGAREKIEHVLATGAYLTLLLPEAAPDISEGEQATGRLNTPTPLAEALLACLHLNEHTEKVRCVAAGNTALSVAWPRILHHLRAGKMSAVLAIDSPRPVERRGEETYAVSTEGIILLTIAPALNGMYLHQHWQSFSPEPIHANSAYLPFHRQPSGAEATASLFAQMAAWPAQQDIAHLLLPSMAYGNEWRSQLPVIAPLLTATTAYHRPATCLGELGALAGPYHALFAQHLLADSRHAGQRALQLDFSASGRRSALLWQHT
ncbi:hypothetical protein WH50_19305 [Pokkaliibacter plantistimulans]|uniref:Uncharacterized protein n=1 Tax=Pokkaliibacter plantistimulans TaxID=1635171 RepID=A0ABX5LWL6_9GAMM|nr:hypothetical protein [Pokkaliibacter plantistimulans]PXF29691.1 hypothetical protein WH50_19305 [Pokkaliibacter plantistimulans]